MVQEGAAAAAAASGPQAAGAAKKKKNKSKNKKKTASTVQATTPTASTAPQPQSSSCVGANVSADRSRSSSDEVKSRVPPAVPEPVVNRALPVVAAAKSPSGDFIHNLAKEFAENYAVYSHWAETKDAEKLYYQQLSKKKAGAAEPAKAAPKAKAEDDDDIDFFASDDEEKPKSQAPLVRVQPKGPPPSVLARQKEQAAKKKGKVDKAPAAAETPKKEAVKVPAPVQKAPEPAASKPVEAASTSSGQVLTCKNPANCERTFLMLKPDAVHRGLAGEIISRFEKKGFKMVAMKFMQASTDLLSKHYADLSKKPFFPELVRYMASGPVLPMVWEGLNVVKTGRVMLGETNPRDSAPGTIRGDFCIDIGRNIIHGSDSVESAQKEIQLWFGSFELVTWRPSEVAWVYEDEEEEGCSSGVPTLKSNLAAEIAKARQHIKNSLECVDGIADMAGGAELVNKLNSLEIENKNLKKVTDDLRNLVLTLEKRVASLEGSAKPTSAPAPAAKAAPAPADDDDDVDLFGSSDEEEDADAAKVREERLKAYAEKKSKKPALIAKTSVLLDVKPWDDETDMDAMLKAVKTIEKDGLVWGASKLVPVGYGINKLQVLCVVEDEKVSIDELCEQIQEFEDFVQSVDIANMSKI